MTTQADDKLEHLARWVLDHFAAKHAGAPNAEQLAKADRAVWLRDEYQRRHGQAATEALKARMLKIHQARRTP